MRFRCKPGLRYTFFILSLLLLPSALRSPAQGQSRHDLPQAPGPSVTPAQDSRRFDVALSGFYQVSGASNGNFIRQDTSESLGGVASFRQSFNPWLGYEINYGFTRYSEFYNKVYSVQHNAHELTAAYLLQTRTPYYGFQAFVTVGTGLMVFAPTSAGGHGQSTQLLPAFVYSVGVNHSVLSDHIGIRVQYRALNYKAPNFNNVLLDAHSLRRTMEPSIGAYFRF